MNPIENEYLDFIQCGFPFDIDKDLFSEFDDSIEKDIFQRIISLINEVKKGRIPMWDEDFLEDIEDDMEREFVKVFTNLADRINKFLMKSRNKLKQQHRENIKSIIKKYERLAKNKKLDFKKIVPDIGIEIDTWLRKRAARGFSQNYEEDEFDKIINFDIFAAMDEEMKQLQEIEKKMENELKEYLKIKPKRNLQDILVEEIPKVIQELKLSMIKNVINPIRAEKKEYLLFGPRMERAINYAIEVAIRQNFQKMKVQGINVNIDSMEKKIQNEILSFYRNAIRRFENTIKNSDPRYLIQEAFKKFKQKIKSPILPKLWEGRRPGFWRIYFNIGRRSIGYFDLVKNSFVKQEVKFGLDDKEREQMNIFHKEFNVNRYPELIDIMNILKKNKNL